MSSTRLKDIRVKRGLSLRDLSDHISLTYTSIGKVERGEQELRANDIVEICSYFKCSSDYLLCISDDDSTSNHLIFDEKERNIIEIMQEVSQEGLKLLTDYANYIKDKYPDTSQKILYNGKQIHIVRGANDEK